MNDSEDCRSNGKLQPEIFSTRDGWYAKKVKNEKYATNEFSRKYGKVRGEKF